MSSVVIAGDSSGTVTLQAPSAAGSTVLTLPATSGTVITTGSTFAGTGPAFSAYSTAGQSVSNGVFTKIQLNAEEFDTNSNFDSTTNYRFTPTVSGYYFLNGQVEVSGAGAGETVAAIYKNGSVAKSGIDITATVYGATVSGLIYLNGSTDYVELYVYVPATRNLINSGAQYNYFQGFLARAA